MLCKGFVTSGRVGISPAISAVMIEAQQQSGVMFRTHIGRPIDLSNTFNRLIVALTAAMAVAGLALWLTGDAPDAWLAPVHTFLIWALVRELDPDRQWTALLAGAVGGAWVLMGLEIVGALALAGLLMAGRLVLNPVGLRPLGTDLGAMAVLATVISFTAVGWLAGFGVALAIYIDAHMAAEERSGPVLAAIAAAVGSSAVATAAGALPERLPSIRPLIVVLVGVLALIIVARDPLPLKSTVDHSDRKLMSVSRLHAARVLIAILVFVAALLAGQDVGGLAPVIFTIALVLAVEEVERIRRPTF